MNQQRCEEYSESMSLAQDGMLNSTQNHLLHAHMATCPPCREKWEAMTIISQVLRAAPMVMPAPGFVARFEERLAYRLEQRRRSMVWLLLGIGVIALTILALPTIIGALRLTGQLVLPYEIAAYLQGLFDWFSIVLNALAEAAGLLLRHSVAQPTGIAFICAAVAGGVFALIWTRLVVSRLATHKTRT